jgi:Ran-binding protein 1
MADTAHKLETPAADAGPTLNEEATEKLTTGVSDKAEEDKPATITEKATAATTAVKDNVFSMFGGGPKKDKVEEEEGENDRSGSAKAMAAKDGAEVRLQKSSSSVFTPPLTL